MCRYRANANISDCAICKDAKAKSGTAGGQKDAVPTSWIFLGDSGTSPLLQPHSSLENHVEDIEIDPQDMLLENALRVVFKASEMLESESLSPDDLQALSGALRDATEIMLSLESACDCGHEHGEDA